MDITTIIVAIVSSIFGGGIGVFFTYKINSRKQGVSEFQALLNERKEIQIDLKNRVAVLEKEVRDLQGQLKDRDTEVQTLRHQLMIFESSHIDIPLPVWMKDTDGKMVFLNNVYEDMFLLPRGYSIKDYLGKNDFSVWSEDIALAFIKNDKEVMRTKKHIRRIEQLEDANGNKYYADLLKYPRKFNNTVIGISGIVLRTAETKEELENIRLK